MFNLFTFVAFLTSSVKSTMKYVLLNLFLWFTCLNGTGQMNKPILAEDIRIPLDSTQQEKLVSSLSAFLESMSDKTVEPIYVDSDNYQVYGEFFDCFSINEKYDDPSYQYHLLNIVARSDHKLDITLSYLGRSETSMVNPLVINLVAEENPNDYTFLCPFEENTQDWSSEKLGNITFYYEYSFDKAIAKEFDAHNTFMASVVDISPLKINYYKCQNLQQVYKVMGVDYYQPINGLKRGCVVEGAQNLFISGTGTEAYNHDLTHVYFSEVIPDSIRNRTAEEGYNINLTDYWGESSEQIYSYLKTYILSHPQQTISELFNDSRTLKYPISTKMPVAAVLMRKVEREHGRKPVLALIACGNTDQDFLAKLEEIAGIDQDNFDATVKEELGIEH